MTSPNQLWTEVILYGSSFVCIWHSLFICFSVYFSTFWFCVTIFLLLLNIVNIFFIYLYWIHCTTTYYEFCATGGKCHKITFILPPTTITTRGYSIFYFQFFMHVLYKCFYTIGITSKKSILCLSISIIAQTCAKDSYEPCFMPFNIFVA